jgi:hypothetical protein
VDAATGDIIVSGVKSALPAALGGLTSSLLSPQVQSQVTDAMRTPSADFQVSPGFQPGTAPLNEAGNFITVTGAPTAPAAAFGNAVGSVVPGLSQILTPPTLADLNSPLAVKPAEPVAPEAPAEDITVTASRSRIQTGVNAIRANPATTVGDLARMGLNTDEINQAYIEGQNPADQTVVEGVKGADINAGSTVGSAAGSLAVNPPTPAANITVTGQKTPVNSGDATGAITGALASDIFAPTPVEAPSDIVVKAPTKADIKDAVGAITSGVVSDISAPPTPPAEDIVVTGQKTPVNVGSVVGALTGSTAATVPTSGVTPDVTAATTGVTDPKKAIDLVQAAKVAALLAGAVGGGAGSGAGAGTYTGTGTGTMGPLFNDPLPTGADVTTIPGGVGTIANLAARTMPEQDWNKYAFKPEQSFFKYVPQAAPAALARGGQPSFAVKGAGDGRSDSIPAVLSDGEYVMDAETVALLGNGSSKAGAKKLDEMRVNIRKQKGRNLARGQFSVKAKQPEAYLAGGRT